MNAGYMREMSRYPPQSHPIRGDEIWRVLTISKGATGENHPDFSGAIVLIWIFISSAGYLGRAQSGFERNVMLVPKGEPFFAGH